MPLGGLGWGPPRWPAVAQGATVYFWVKLINRTTRCARVMKSNTGTRQPERGRWLAAQPRGPGSPHRVGRASEAPLTGGDLVLLTWATGLMKLVLSKRRNVAKHSTKLQPEERAP